ncbi:1599_t:CDS:1, partial [Acaulospora colombiana]
RRSERAQIKIADESSFHGAIGQVMAASSHSDSKEKALWMESA